MDRSLEPIPASAVGYALTDLELKQLSQHGYLSLNGQQHSELMTRYSELFKISGEYFALNDSSDAKTRYRAPTGPGASEEGYSRIPGEKQIFTCRAFNRTPHKVSVIAEQAWKETGLFLDAVMHQIAVDLDLSPSSNGEVDRQNPFTPLLSHCLNFTNNKTPTLLRLFRYDRPLQDSSSQTHMSATQEAFTSEIQRPNTSHVVAEQHKDLGLLSLVVGSSSGLEVFNESTNSWIPIEEPDYCQRDKNGLTITLLNGQCLRYLTRNQYRAGVHRVRVSPRTLPDGQQDPHRFSIVFALRPFPNEIKLSTFESARIGKFSLEERTGVDGQSAAVLFNKICGQHWNINIAKDIREEQRQSTRSTGGLTHTNQAITNAHIATSHNPQVSQNSSHSAGHGGAVINKENLLQDRMHSGTETRSKSTWINRKWASMKGSIRASRSPDLKYSS